MRPTDIPDLKSAAFLADRYPTYRRLQSDFPHFEIDINGEDCIVLTRYSDVDEVLRNPLATVQQAPGVFPDRIGNGAGARFYRESLPNIDAPDHTRIRRIVTPAFNPRTVANMRGWVEKVIVEHLDRLEGQDEIDFVSAFADPVPAEIACRLLHVPLSDARELFARQHGLNAVLSVSDITPERLAEADASAAFYYEYMDDVLDTLRGKLPEDDFVGALMAAEGGDNGLTRSELVTTLIGFLVASYHTTKVAMTNTVLALLSHDGERARLMAQPDLARNAWEESLRYDSPVHFIHRYASETHGRRPGHRAGQAAAAGTACGEPGRGPLPAGRPLPDRPARQPPSGLRGRRPFLPGLAAVQTGRRCAAAHDLPALSRHAPDGDALRARAGPDLPDAVAHDGRCARRKVEWP